MLVMCKYMTCRVLYRVHQPWILVQAVTILNMTVRIAVFTGFTESLQYA